MWEAGVSVLAVMTLEEARSHIGRDVLYCSLYRSACGEPQRAVILEVIGSFVFIRSSGQQRVPARPEDLTLLAGQDTATGGSAPARDLLAASQASLNEIVAAFQVTAKAAIAIEAEVLRWWRRELGLPSYLSRGQMPQGGWTETVAAGSIDLPATVTRICNLAVLSPAADLAGPRVRTLPP